MSQSINRLIGGHLYDAAEMLEHDGADAVYVRAYRAASDSVRRWPISLAVMYAHRGVQGLEEVPSVGPRIARVIRELLTHHRLPPLTALQGETSNAHLDVEEILDVDREYRRKAAADELPLTAPHHFNSSNQYWLPVLHTTRGSRRYTALFSNTERAHRLGRTHDWVVVYVQAKGDEQRQYTVITAIRGGLRGRRVVAGHERECRAAERRSAA
jgi:helix-hairpin-helix protein